MAAPENPVQILVTWLLERAAAVRACEEQARTALYEENDEVRYRENMAERTALLASIADDAAALTAALPEPEKTRVQDTLAFFAGNARRAQSLGSVFYMSALLYPDTHKEGEPNNLEKLIASLE